MISVLTLVWGVSHAVAAPACTHPAGNTPIDSLGDADASGTVTVTDVQCSLLSVLVEGGCAAATVQRLDVNCDGGVNISDSVLTINLALYGALPADFATLPDGCPVACEPCVKPGQASCLIDGACVPLFGTLSFKAEACALCQPKLDPFGWTILSCDDGDACTEDECNPKTGACESAALVGGDCVFTSCEGAPDLSRAEMLGIFVAEALPLLTAEPTEGGCAGCHHADSGREMQLLDDPTETFDRLWADGFLSKSTPDNILGRLQGETGLGMPLGGLPWPAAEIQVLADMACLIEASTDSPLLCDDDIDPGAPALRRLTNFEYDQTVAHAVLDDTQPAQGFPADTVSQGFTGVGVAQLLDGLRLERYYEAAVDLAHDTLHIPEAIALFLEAEALQSYSIYGSPHGYALEDGADPDADPDARRFWATNGYVTTGVFEVPYPGTYVFRTRLRGLNYETITNDFEAVTHHAQIALIANSVPIVILETDGTETYEILETEVELDAGFSELRVQLNNYKNNAKVEMRVDWLELTGPSTLPPADPTRREIFLVCPTTSDAVVGGTAEGSCVADTVDNLLRRIWRRPPTDEEYDRYVDLLVDTLVVTGDYDEAVEIVLEAALLSPHFLFKVELDEVVASTEPHPVSPHELAVRLAYFIWAGPPDAELVALADAGALVEPVVLAAQVDRLLDDPRAIALIDNFARQWFDLDGVLSAQPIPSLYPEFTPELAQSMYDEIALNIAEVFAAEVDVRTLFDFDETYVDAELAAHYGLSDYVGPGFEKHSLAGTHRKGLLTTAGLLTATSHPNRTSTVKRGKYVLDRVLCQPPNPPPDDIPDIEAPDDGSAPAGSLKELMIAHATDPVCAGCHVTMDPIGFGLENFGATGAWRMVDDYGFDVDPTGVLPDGTAFDGPIELIDALKDDPAIVECVAEKMTVYALGRALSDLDACAYDDVKTEFFYGGYTLRSLVHALVASPLFQTRRGEEEPLP